MADSDEDSESYVVLGEAIGTVLPDEPLKRPLSVNELPVTDKEGRVRFHGAFTGGFSAGYFNSVGSKEGWAPATFVSNRKNRGEKSLATPEDFMDDEDFSEHGIAPRMFVTSDSFKSEERASKRKALASSLLSNNTFLHQVDGALLDFIVPEKLSIGVRLLRKMGWKEGQGVGPRQRRRKKIKQKTDTKKQYGCAVPQSGSDSEVSDDDLPENVEFAPEDTCHISFIAKDNLHGFGYQGINVKAALPSTHVSLFSEPSRFGKIVEARRNNKGIQGTAFGVGAMEEDDDDIYAVDSLSKYDQSIGSTDHDEEALYGWTAPGRNKPGAPPPTSYVGKVLEGFTLSSKPLPPRTVYPLPQIPKGYRPYHTFKKLPPDLQPPSEVTGGQNSSLTAFSRGLILGEIKTTGSVFDLISKSSRDSLPKPDNKPLPDVDHKPNLPFESQPQVALSSDTSVPSNNSSSIISSSIPVVLGDTSSNSQTDEAAEASKRLGVKPFKIQMSQLLQTSSALQTGFQPFAEDPIKQERYNKYLLLLRHGKIDPFDEVSDSQMTEWEQATEKDEFSKAARLYKPLMGSMASRFTIAKFADNVESATLPTVNQASKDDLSRAAEMKLYGKLTREVIEWHPDRLLCRRFNVPDPHPGSGIIGVPKVKRDKFSVFNFLSAPLSLEEGNRTQPTTAVDSSLLTSEQSPAAGEASTTNEIQASIPVIKAEEPDSNVSPNTEKPSIFSHLMTEKLPTSKPIPVSATVTSNKTTAVSQSQSSAKTDDAERPPMDLFKAIFADSSSDEDDDDNDKMEEKKEEERDVASMVVETVSALFGKDVKVSNPAAIATPAAADNNISIKEIPLPTSLTDSTGKSKPEIQVTQSQQSPREIGPEKSSGTDTVEVYGPALPPTFSANPVEDNKALDPLDQKLLTFLKKSSSKKHKHKSKHKSKKSQKDKHRVKKDKKHKKSKKKKKHSSSKSKVSPSSSSSSSASSV